MANYPTPIGFRMPFDVDGTQVFYRQNGGATVTQLNSGQLASLNSEATTGVNLTLGFSNNQDTSFFFLFPQRRDVIGFFVATNGGQTITTVDWSNTTTTGLDGSWTSFATSYVSSSGSTPGYRTNQNTSSVSNVSALRFRYNVNASGNFAWQCIHVFGALTTPTADRLTFWHPTLSQEFSLVDFQDITRGTTSTVQFRVKNMSSTLTANTVSVSTNVPTDASPTIGSQISYSTDNVTYTSTLSLGNLAPGAVSGTLYMKNALLSNAAVSLWAGRVKVSAVSFS